MPAAERSASHRRAAVVFAVLSAVVASGCAMGDTSEEELSDTYDGDVATVVLRFDDQGASQIGVTSAAISAHVTGADRDGVRVDRTLEHTDGDRPEEEIVLDGDTLTITAACPGHFVVGTPTCLAGYDIEVPRGTVVRATSHHGSLRVAGTGAEVELSSHNGDLEVAVADDTAYAVDATSEDGATTVAVPHDPAGVPLRLTSHDGDVTVGSG